MATCRNMAQILYSAAEGETTAEESLHLANHLPDCTACRIRLARERRLAEMLDAVEDALQVEGTFTEEVMAALPEGPPPVPEGGLARLRRRGLRLLGIAGLVTAGASLLSKLASLGSGAQPIPGVPRFSLEGTEPLFDNLLGLLRFLGIALSRIGSGIDLGLQGLQGLTRGTGFSPHASGPVLLALLMISAAVLFARTTLRGQASPSSWIRFSSAGTGRPRRLAEATRSPRISVSTRRT